MKEYIEIEAFENDIKEKKFEKVFKEIVEKSMDLIKRIAKKRQIILDIKDGDNKEDIFYNILFSFERNTIYFTGVVTLMNSFLRWNIAPEDDFGETKEEKLEKYVNIYNAIIGELDYYEKAEKEIQIKGYEELKNEKIDSLIQVFKEMLKYKNKEYNENWSFEEWIDKIDMTYHYYHLELQEVLEVLKFGYYFVDIEKYNYDSIEVNEVETIILLENLYAILTCKGEDYTYFANFYKEIELKDDQTYSDVYDIEIEKLAKLFKEMLDYANVKYDTTDFFSLRTLICRYYPYYTDTIIHLRALMSMPDETYISKINSMEAIYENLSKSYKNYVGKIIIFYAMNYAVDNNGISISDILSKFKISYLLAQKIIKKLEERQIIKEDDETKKEKCVISKEEWQEKRRLLQNDLKLDDDMYEEYINNNLKYKKLEDTEDELLTDVVDFILETGEVKNSSIKNKFGISYARAGRIIDQIEARDIISKKGEILITKEEWKENKQKLLT